MSLHGNTDKAQNSAIASAKIAKDITDSTVAEIKTGVGIVLPTSDPAVAGELWANVGIVTVSAG